jgi:ABC-2 type transport system ATP-binding protein
VTALDGLSFALHPGEVLGLLGPNGAGKTTAVENSAGLVMADEGTIALDGKALDRAGRRGIGLALQASALQDTITPREALALFARLYGVAPDVADILDRMGLSDLTDTYYGRLSGGQKQRVALAIALVNDPKVLLLDEPTAGLDPAARADLHRRIGALAEGGRAILLATHDMAEAEKLCDRVLVIDRGRAVAEGSPADLVGRAGAGMAIEGRAAAALTKETLPPIPGLTISGSDFRCRTTAPARTATDILAAFERQGIAIVSLRIGRPTLEDVILGLIEERVER